LRESKNITMGKKWYFIDKDGDKKGPYSFDEISKREIKENTLIWTEGMMDWKEAKIIDEFKIRFGQKPPPTPKEKMDGYEKDNGKREYKGVKTEKYIINSYNSAFYFAIIYAIFNGFYFYKVFTFEFYNMDIVKQIVIQIISISIFVYLTYLLKEYLTKLNKYTKANKHIDTIIFATVLFTIADIIENNTYNSEVIRYIELGSIGLGLVTLFAYLALSIKLLGIDYDFSGFIKVFAVVSIVFPVLSLVFATIHVIEETEETLILSVISSIIPVLFLGILFYITKQRIDSHNEKIYKDDTVEN
jgi:hypothetical protein